MVYVYESLLFWGCFDSVLKCKLYVLIMFNALTLLRLVFFLSEGSHPKYIPPKWGINNRT